MTESCTVYFNDRTALLAELARCEARMRLDPSKVVRLLAARPVDYHPLCTGLHYLELLLEKIPLRL